MNSELHLGNADLKYWINEFPFLEKIESETEKIQFPKREVLRSRVMFLRGRDIIPKMLQHIKNINNHW